jgi:uncharacterized membrane protein YqaE (UPF0057 family)
MTLKKSLLVLSLCLFALNASSMTVPEPVTPTPFAISAEQGKQLDAVLANLASQDFSKLTINQVEQLTGKQMTFKEKIAFKVAKMKMKKIQHKATVSMQSSDGLAAPTIDKGIYILLAIIGWGFVGIGLASDWSGNEWLYCLLLTFLCWIPGLIYALMKMKNYYS